MNSYEILKKVHKVGHPISGVVNRYEKYNRKGHTYCKIELITDSNYKSILPYSLLFDEPEPFNEALLPKIGSEIRTIVRNHSNDVLYLSAKPSELEDAAIEKYRQFYSYVESIEEGTEKEGIVLEVRPFGLFVDLALPFIGLIDFGHSDFNGGERLPYDNTKWPKKDSSINCVIQYFRFRNKQFGLGWLP